MFFSFFKTLIFKTLKKKNYLEKEKNLDELRYLRKEAEKYILKKENKIEKQFVQNLYKNYCKINSFKILDLIF